MTQTTESTPLFERLGGAEGVAAIASDIVDRHYVNPVLKTRFSDVEIEPLRRLVIDFFNMGSGGPAQYTGRDMRTAHIGMNANERELIAIIDDALAVLDAHGVDPVSRNEVLAILYSFKHEVLFQ